MLNRYKCLSVLMMLPLFTAAGREKGDLIDVPKGSFIPLFPDSENEKALIQKETKVNRFKIQRDSVTNEDFLRFVANHPQWRKDQTNDLFFNEVYLNHWTTPSTFLPTLRLSPVTHVSWFAADAYCRSLNMRLPTTNEWEYVASYPLVVDKKLLTEKEKAKKILEWYGEPSHSNIQSVKDAYQNNLGVRGLFGLVWEWTYDFNSVLMSTDNRSNSDMKNGLFCGGGAIGSSSPEDYARFMRYAHRSSLTGRYSAANLGFRCAK